jgi:hypothetical protein
MSNNEDQHKAMPIWINAGAAVTVLAFWGQIIAANDLQSPPLLSITLYAYLVGIVLGFMGIYTKNFMSTLFQILSISVFFLFSINAINNASTAKKYNKTCQNITEGLQPNAQSKSSTSVIFSVPTSQILETLGAK